jgi:hypothetical protein
MTLSIHTKYINLFEGDKRYTVVSKERKKDIQDTVK